MTIKQKLIASTAIWIPLMTGACSDSSLRIATHAQLESLDPIKTTAYITRSHGYLVYDTLFALIRTSSRSRRWSSPTRRRLTAAPGRSRCVRA